MEYLEENLDGWLGEELEVRGTEPLHRLHNMSTCAQGPTPAIIHGITIWVQH